MAPSLRTLAPLNALRAFEAAARHLSFSRAAEELHVTPAAISHQIRQLEEYCGQELFRRLTRALALTEVGAAALPAASRALDLLAEATELLCRPPQALPLKVSVEPSFAAKWLVPRLDGFRRLHPEIDVWLDASTRLVDFTREPVDCAIRYGSADLEDVRVDRLLQDRLVPVLSPELLASLGRPITAADLASLPLLHLDWTEEDGTAADWPAWLEAAAVPDIDGSRGPRFNVDSMAVQAALAGQGVALVSSALVADDIAAGRLVAPFDLSLPGAFAYHLLAPAERADEPAIRAFREWLLALARPV